MTYDGRDSGDSWERAGHKAGSFLRRTGRQVAEWFNAGGEGQAYDDLSTNPRTGGAYRSDGHRGRGPQGYKRADERISEDAHERLTDDSWLDASNVSVSVSNGEVTLSGTVEHREAKHRAERIVEDIPGVTHVQNNLRVAKGNYFTTPGSGYGDSVLGAQIRDAEAEGAPSSTASPLSSSATMSSGSATTNGGKKT
ncbi:MAG: BON domain-containing protein [Proteobacteria bacterium]|nr:BON domain-containing protein [Pseudomonadota bacterium]